MRRVRHLFDALISRARFERDLRDEIRLHIDERARDLVASGIAPPEAARQARVEFGAVERYKEQCRDARGFAAMRPFHGFTTDVRLAARRLIAAPLFTVFAALSLGIGIGVTTAAYSILYSLFWKPLGIAEPARVMVVAASAGAYSRLSGPDFVDVQRSIRSFDTMAASAPFYEVLQTPGESKAVEGEAVSGEYFRVTGVPMAIGRAIDDNDDTSSARVIVLNDQLWRSRFHADRAVIGRTVRLGGQTFEIVGVAPRTFDGALGPLMRTGWWIPLRSLAAFGPAAAAAFESGTQQRLTVIGHLLPGRTRAAAAGELAAARRRLDRERPIHHATADGTSRVVPRTWMLRGLDERNDTDSHTAVVILALVALVLVVACTNLANLMLARGAARQREMAVRRAMGAGRWRLVRELLVEGGALAALGGAAALLLIRALLNLATFDVPTPGRMFSLEPALNAPAFLVAAGALVLATLVFALEPAWQLTRARVLPDLGGGDYTVGAVPAARQRAFIRWQVAASVAFFLIAAVFARAVVAQARHDPGIDLDRLAVATVFLPRQSWDEARARAAVAAIADQLRHERGIERVAVSTGMPFGLNSTSWAAATTPDKPFTPHGQLEITDMIAATPDIFATLGVRLLRGRAFDDRDDAGAPRVMVVSEKTAKVFFGTADVIGRQLLTKSWGREPIETWTIVGVARDTDSGFLMSRGNETTYVPLAQHYEPFFVISARTGGAPASAALLMRKVSARVAPDLALGSAGAASIVLAGRYFVARVAAALATALGGLTLVLAMIGLYGVQSHLVARRTREVGVRMALGASSPQIARMLLGEGFRPVFQGLAIGFALSVLARLTLRAFLVGSIQPVDLAAFAIVPIPLVIAAFVASYLPARAAAQVDPNVALRHL
jgi:predicted permease